MRFDIPNWVSAIADYLIPIWPRVKATSFNLWVAVNMLLCAVLFGLWSRPRETLSGFIGRQTLMGSSIAYHVAIKIDWVYRKLFDANEDAHCGSTALMEDEARFVLYPGTQIADENIESYSPEHNPQK